MYLDIGGGGLKQVGAWVAAIAATFGFNFCRLRTAVAFEFAFKFDSVRLFTLPTIPTHP